jgi:hypothetical protein
MVRALLILVLVYVPMIYVFSVLAVHVELRLTQGFTSLAWPTLAWPFDALRGKGISWGLVIGAGLAAGAAELFFRAFVVRRWGWVSEEQHQSLLGINKK